MSKPHDRTVFRNAEGKWVNKRNDANRASSIHDTQKRAIAYARGMLQLQGGGDLTTMGADGNIVSRDTIVPGNDPFPPRDTEY